MWCFNVAVREGGVSVSVLSQVAALLNKKSFSTYDTVHSRCDMIHSEEPPGREK